MQNLTLAPQEATDILTRPMATFLLAIDCQEVKVVLIPLSMAGERFIELSRVEARGWMEAKLLLGIPLSKRDWARLADDRPQLPAWKW